LGDTKKKVDDVFKDDVPNEQKESEKTVKDVLKLNNKLLRMGYDQIAKDALKIHDHLLGIKEDKAKTDIDKQTSLLLRDKKGYVYGKLGVRKDVSKNELSKNEPSKSESSKEDLQKSNENYRLFMQNIRGSIGLWLDDNLVPTFIDGSVKEVTGYDKEDFHYMDLKWIELVIPEDRPLVLEYIEWVKTNPNTYAEIEYRIRRKEGDIRWVREIIHVLPENQKSQGTFQSFVRDINERKEAEESMKKLEEAQK
jgi:PAS domain S-box-containing protein